MLIMSLLEYYIDTIMKDKNHRCIGPHYQSQRRMEEADNQHEDRTDSSGKATLRP